MSTDVEDGVEIRSGEGGELDSVLDEFLGSFIFKKLGGEFVVLERFDRGLKNKERSVRQPARREPARNVPGPRVLHHQRGRRG